MTEALQKCYSTQLSENRRTLTTARRPMATRRRARLRWQRSPRAGGGNDVAPSDGTGARSRDGWLSEEQTTQPDELHQRRILPLATWRHIRTPYRRTLHERHLPASRVLPLSVDRDSREASLIIIETSITYLVEPG